jgi:hypothetical protein
LNRFFLVTSNGFEGTVQAMIDEETIPKHDGLICLECGGTWGVYAVPYPFDTEGWVQHYCQRYRNGDYRIIARPSEIGQEAVNLVWLAKIGSKVDALKAMGRLPLESEYWL